MPLKSNTEIKIQLVKLGENQSQLARATGIGRALLNQIINGRVNPRQEEKEVIASCLKVNPSEIFPS